MATLPTKLFKSPAELGRWIAGQSSDSPGVWMKIAKKDVRATSVTYAEALDVALCYGWIDGQKQKLNDSFWLQKFTPRRARSGWSKVNTEHVTRLIKAGKMMPAGTAEINRAKKDGRWKAAYHPSSRSIVPKDLALALNKNAKAKKFFATLNSTNRYAILYRVQTAKRPETRSDRIKKFVKMLADHQTLH